MRWLGLGSAAELVPPEKIKVAMQHMQFSIQFICSVYTSTMSSDGKISLSNPCNSVLTTRSLPVHCRALGLLLADCVAQLLMPAWRGFSKFVVQ